MQHFTLTKYITEASTTERITEGSKSTGIKASPGLGGSGAERGRPRNFRQIC